MDNFLNLAWWKQLLMVTIGIPLTFFFIYVITRVITTAFLKSYVEYKKDLINKIFSLSGTKSQNNPKKEGGQGNVST